MPHSAWPSRRVSPGRASTYSVTTSAADISNRQPRGSIPTPRVPAVRALVQRVTSASVTVEGEEVARIGAGLLVLLSVRRGDGEEEADRIARKLLALRVFEDDGGRMNLSV